jgi:hypothetical protein
MLQISSDSDDDEPTNDVGRDEQPQISLLALSGIRSSRTMQLRVTIGGASLTALVDTGSTHNFVASELTERVGLTVRKRAGLSVAVANGDRITSDGICCNTPIIIDQEAFSLDFYAIPLGGFDVVLGVQWLSTLGPILWDFTQLSMAFRRDNRWVVWHGEAATIGTPTLLAATGQDLLAELLEEFGTLFAEPTGLPPARAHDHRIHLVAGTEVVVVRPYRYLPLQKDELERQCAALLDQKLIRRSNSAFSAPVLLVKKRDGSFWPCIDYRALNAKTIKDKFPIPVVEELLDELKGTRFFTKLDLRSGYHQVRMHPLDIEKTAFRTHEGLFKFLVMPFGLTNAPATFQALMNDVLRSFLRRFVLVFFDDILIYSTSWADHIRHMRAVFLLLRQHQLFLKRPKCFFGETSVSYLGHVITADGVAMDTFQGGWRHGLAYTTHSPGSTRIPGSRRLLSPLYPGLRHHCGTIDSPSPQGRVLLVGGGR